MTTVLYVHGLESGPGGAKVRALREAGFEVQAAKMPCNSADAWKDPALWLTVLAALGVVVGLTMYRGISGFVSGAVLVVVLSRVVLPLLTMRMVRRSVDVQKKMLKSHAIDVVVGSSFGGAVTLELLRQGAWSGRTVLLCPAQRLVAARTGRAAPKLPADTAHIVVVHGTRDETVPLFHSRDLVKDTHARFIEVNDTHRLAETATPENLKTWISLSLQGEGQGEGTST